MNRPPRWTDEDEVATQGPAPDVLAEPPMGPAGALPATPGSPHRWRIVHLSDLHFGRQFDRGLWEYVVGQILVDLAPVQMIVVTGDLVDSPSLFGLGLARRELDELGRRAGCPVRVIAGNHDMGVLGNIAVWPFTRKFDIVFGTHHAALFNRLPTWQAYRAQGRGARLATRARWAWGLGWRRLAGRLSWRGPASCGVLGPQEDGSGQGLLGQPGPEPERALLVGFNSSQKLWLATGRVDEGEALSLDTRLAVLRQQRDPRWMCPRIALVHHHLLPIPYSTARESLTAFEPFLVLRNAGTLAQQLVNLEFDLVLHGHKHYWHAARVALDAGARSSGELAVVAAGSATVSHDEPGRNSFNVIDLMPNGGIVHRAVFYGAGITARAGQALKRQAQPRSMFSLESLKLRARRKAVAMAGSCADLAERQITIDENGSGDYRLLVHGLRVFESRRTRKQTLTVALASGAIAPSSVQLDPISAEQGHTLDTREITRPVQHLQIPVDLGRELFSREAGQAGVSFGARCRAINTFAINEWEAQALDSPGPDDWVALVVRQPALRARLRVALPALLRDPTPRLAVMRPRGYPRLPFERNGEAALPEPGPEAWEFDQDMTNHEQARLVRVADGAWQLDIDNPMVGFRYEIRWQVRTVQRRQASSMAVGRTGELREQLLGLGGAAAAGAAAGPSDAPSLLDKARGMLELMHARIVQPALRSELKPDERLGLTVFVYDDGRSGRPPAPRKVLRRVFGAGSEPQTGGVDFIPLNEGVTGKAFKTRSLALYASPQVVGRDHDGGYVYYPPDAPLPAGDDECTALVAIPLFLTDSVGIESTPEEMIGVLTISSNALDSGLLRLIDPTATGAPAQRSSAPDREGELGSMLWRLGWGFVNGLANELAQMARPHAPTLEEPGDDPDNDAQGVAL